MAKGVVEQIKETAVNIVQQHPDGIGTGDLVERVKAALPDANHNTTATVVGELYKTVPAKVFKPERGVLKPVAVSAIAAAAATKNARAIPPENLFYEPFAHWVKDVLDEVTAAAPWGGSSMKTKWGTPDVVGVYRSVAADLVKFPPEIVSAEIKSDPSQPVVAFGQATAYRLFSSKSYVVLPIDMTEEDRQRTESLCMLFGVGLVLFKLDPANPDFQIRVRAQRFSPDMFYVNEFAHGLRKTDEGAFNQLFG